MKKKVYSQKLVLNKKRIADLAKGDMIILRGGGDPTDIGVTCYTGPCCQTNECMYPNVPFRPWTIGVGRC